LYNCDFKLYPVPIITSKFDTELYFEPQDSYNHSFFMTILGKWCRLLVNPLMVF